MRTLTLITTHYTPAVAEAITNGVPAEAPDVIAADAAVQLHGAYEDNGHDVMVFGRALPVTPPNPFRTDPGTELFELLQNVYTDDPADGDSDDLGVVSILGHKLTADQAEEFAVAMFGHAALARRAARS